MQYIMTGTTDRIPTVEDVEGLTRRCEALDNAMRRIRDEQSAISRKLAGVRRSRWKRPPLTEPERTELQDRCDALYIESGTLHQQYGEAEELLAVATSERPATACGVQRVRRTALIAARDEAGPEALEAARALGLDLRDIAALERADVRRFVAVASQYAAMGEQLAETEARIARYEQRGREATAAASSADRGG